MSKRQQIKEGLAKCTESQRIMFRRMYAQGDLSKPIDEVVDDMPPVKLDRAMEQIEATLRKMEKA